MSAANPMLTTPVRPSRGNAFTDTSGLAQGLAQLGRSGGVPVGAADDHGATAIVAAATTAAVAAMAETRRLWRWERNRIPVKVLPVLLKDGVNSSDSDPG